jgi:hypothetical protein
MSSNQQNSSEFSSAKCQRGLANSIHQNSCKNASAIVGTRLDSSQTRVVVSPPDSQKAARSKRKMKLTFEFEICLQRKESVHQAKV